MLEHTPGKIAGVVLSNTIRSGIFLPGGSKVMLKPWFISEQDSSPLTKSIRTTNTSKVGKAKT